MAVATFRVLAGLPAVTMRNNTQRTLLRGCKQQQGLCRIHVRFTGSPPPAPASSIAMPMSLLGPQVTPGPYTHCQQG